MSSGEREEKKEKPRDRLKYCTRCGRVWDPHSYCPKCGIMLVESPRARWEHARAWKMV
jgi:rRNA maturation endonuclease Nob1